MTDRGQVKIPDFGLAKLAPSLTPGPSPPARGWTAEGGPGDGATVGGGDAAATAVTAGEESLTSTGMVVGTVEYMSPEQVRAEELDARTDLFSFGLVLYEMATGRCAFAGGSPGTIFDAIVNRAPVPPLRINPELPDELDKIISKALEKDRKLRYQSASEIRTDLLRLKRDRESGRVGAGLVPAPEGRPRGAPLRRRWIVAIAGAAIVVVAAVLLALNVAALRDWIFGKPPAPKIESLAVLPLQNLSGDPEQEYFSDGMTEELIATLGKLSALRVISRTSVMQFKGVRPKGGIREIAQQLNVDAVVEGSVRSSGGRVRITAQLIDARTDRHLWAETYERDVRDVLSLQGEVTQAIAREIRIALTPTEQARLARTRPVDPEPYQQYLKGNFQLLRVSEAAFRSAVEYYQKAIERDQSCAPAFAGLSIAYQEVGGWHGSLPFSALHAQAKEAALRALELDDNLAEAHIALGGLKFYEWDCAGADREFRRGIELKPTATFARMLYANYLTAMGRFDESIAIGKQTVELDPLSPAAYAELGCALFQAGRDVEGLEQCEKGLNLDPNSGQSNGVLADFYAKKGMAEKTIAQVQKLESLAGETIPPTGLGWLGTHYARAGRRSDALRILRELERRAKTEYVPAVALAEVHLGLGEREKALDFLERAYKEHDISLVWLKALWRYDPLRSDPRFQDLLRRMNFPP